MEIKNFKRLYQCQKCKRLDAALLPCSHVLCKLCLVEHMKTHSLDKYCTEFVCPECKNEIYFEFILAFFMSDNEFYEFFIDLNLCVFCKKETQEPPVELSCKHRSCKFCIVKLVNKLNEEQKHFTKGVCGNCDCLIHPRVYAKFIAKKQLKALYNADPVFEIKKYYCRKCDITQLTDEKLNGKCKNCQTSFCYVCNQEKHTETCRGNTEKKPQMENSKKINNSNDKIIIPKVLINQASNNENKIFNELLQTVCKVCKNNQGEKYNCDHYYCNSCLKALIIKSLEKDPLNDIFCEECQKIIPQQAVTNCFEGINNFMRVKQVFVDLIFMPKFLCGICLAEFYVHQSITLECDHRYCQNCIENYFNERITSSNVSEAEFVCPDCNKPVDHNIIKGIVSDVLYNKYIDFAFRN